MANYNRVGFTRGPSHQSLTFAQKNLAKTVSLSDVYLGRTLCRAMNTRTADEPKMMDERLLP